jgi:transposase InsO family protein
MRSWVSPSIRNDVVAFTLRYADLAGLSIAWVLARVGIRRDKFYHWRQRRGRPNLHNAAIPRRFWLQDWEKQAILDFHLAHPDEGYRRLTFMMLDQDIVATSPASTYRVLKQADLIRPSGAKPSRKGTGFDQPSEPHQHWHVDVSYLNISGTFYYFCGILDGCSRFILHWEIRQAMTAADVEIILQRAREKFPNLHPRVISDNGPQFIAREFKEFIRLAGMTHVRTSPFYPQSNGKLERFHQSLKRECIRPKTPLSLDHARSLVAGYVDHYNNTRLHGAIGYITPRDRLQGNHLAIFEQRRAKLQHAQHNRRAAWQALHQPTTLPDPDPEIPCLTEAAA